MNQPIKEIPLANGLTVRFFDATRRYFGDYHQVRIHIVCEVPLVAELFEDDAARQAALKLLGDRASYRKEIEQQGVPTVAVEETVRKVIDHFVEHSLGYFEGEAFPKKLVQSELKRVSGKVKPFVLRGYHG